VNKHELKPFSYYEPKLPAGFEISKTIDGDPCSYTDDDVWNLEAYKNTRSQPPRLYFAKWHEENKKREQNSKEKLITGEFKWLIFLLIYHAENRLKLATLYQYYRSLSHFARLLVEYDKTFNQLFSDEEVLKKITKDKVLSSYLLQGFAAITGHLNAIGFDISGIRAISTESDFIKEIGKRVQEGMEECRQTSVIPERILPEILSTFKKHIDDFLKVKGKIHNLLKAACEDENYARGKSAQTTNKLKKKLHSPYFNEAVSEHGLSDYMTKYDITELKKVTGHLRDMQIISHSIICAYSGMRHSEALSLGYNCLEKEETKRGLVRRLHGYTTKFVKGIPKKKVSWVTSEDADGAVMAARAISGYVAGATGADKKDGELFHPMSCFPWRFSRSKDASPAVQITKAFREKWMGHIKVTAEDILDLRQVDPRRDWEDDEEVKVGEIWPLKCHQFRRSLAVYAIQSGHVTLQALKEQLKHITMEMVRYYARNARKKHLRNDFHREMIEILPFFEASSQHRFMSSGEEVADGQGVPVKAVTDGKGRVLTIEETEKKIKDGVMAFRHSHLGGCTNPGICEKPINEEFAQGVGKVLISLYKYTRNAY